jgi:ubiquinone/menaquinone biosynthesis C-methylase UbiE
MSFLDDAFAHPRGFAGYLGATIMAHSTKDRHAWTLSLLDIHPTDSILEVGFGPGVLLHALASRVPEGLVAGVDASLLMVQQASRRNHTLIERGRVVLREGSALALPFADGTFNLALAANSLHIWPDQLGGIKEMHRVLKAGGMIALIVQPVWAKTDQEVKDIGTDIVTLLTQAGFQEVKMEFKAMKPKSGVAVLGTKA